MQSAMKLGRITRISFGTVIVLMILLGSISKITMNQLLGAVGWVTHTYEIKESLAQIAEDIALGDAAQRGYILTGQPRFLAVRDESLENIPQMMAEVRKLIGTTPGQQERFREFEAAYEKKAEASNRALELALAGNRQAAIDLVGSDNFEINQELLQALKALLAGEDSLLTQRSQDAKAVEYWSTVVSLAGTAIAIALALGTLVFISRWVIRPINEVANAIASSSSEIASTVEEQERIASQQAASVSQTTATMDELYMSSQQSADQASLAASSAQQVLTLADKGTSVVDHTLSDMEQLKNKVEAIAEQILRLSEQTSQIGSISGLVGDIATQTNMLALNAAVEAVRAGESGKGFAVVAAEIRKLADQSRKSAEKISGLVTEVQNSINSTVMVTDEGTKTVDQSVQTVQIVADNFMSVAEAINHVVISSQQISANAKQQAIAIQQVLEAMNQLNQGAVQTASGISQTRVGTHKLNEAAVDLQTVV